MRFLRFGAAVGVAFVPFIALANNALTGLELSKIEAVMADLNCRFKPEEIEKQGDQIVLSDVFCADGQFDIRLSAEFELISKRPV